MDAAPPPGQEGSARRRALLDASYAYVLEHGLGELSLRPLAASIGSSPRVLLFLFGSKDGLVQALLAQARADEQAVLDRVRRARGASGPTALAAIWGWLVAPEHRALLTLWLEGYSRAVTAPGGPWAGFAARTVTDWLAVLDDVGDGDEADRTLDLAVLRGALLDLLATGDVERTSAAVSRHLDVRAERTPSNRKPQDSVGPLP